MPLPLPPNIVSWLANHPQALKDYQAGHPPFELACFSRQSLDQLNQIIDQLTHNDSYRRHQSLHYENTQAKQAVFQQIKQLTHEKQLAEITVFVKNLKTDHAILAANYYRQLSQPLQFNHGWQKYAHLSEERNISELQQQWQSRMPWAFCTSQDLLEKMPLLRELEAYQWLADHTLQSHPSLPVEFRAHYQQWLAQFSHAIVHVRQEIIDAMLAILRAISLTNDLTCDNIINTEALPLLKKIGMLKSDTPTLSLPHALNAAQFAHMIASIQTQGTPDQQAALAQLPLFEARLTDKFPLTATTTLSGRLILVPTSLKTYFTEPSFSLVNWLPKQLRLNRKRQERCFKWETAYEIMQLNQALEYLEQQIHFPTDAGLTTHITTLQHLYQAERQLEHLIDHTVAKKPSRLLAWIFNSASHMVDTWLSELQQQRVALLHQKIALAEQMVQTLEIALTGIHINLDPSLLKSVHRLFEHLPAQLNALPRNERRALEQQFERVQQHYQNAAQFSAHFLKKVQKPDTFLMTRPSRAPWKVIQFDTKQVSEWVQAYTALVSPEEARGMRLIGQMITGEAYPEASIIYALLQPLFQHEINPAASLQQFMDHFLQQMILPQLHSMQDPAYLFVKALAPALAKQWVITHRTQLEGAIQLVQHVLNVDVGQEMPLDGSQPPLLIQEENVWVDGEKVRQCIEQVRALSTREQNHTLALLTAAQHYLAHSEQHMGYNGSNLTYHLIISAIASATGNEQLIATYGSRRFHYLLTQCSYESIVHDPLLQEHRSNLCLQQLIQAELDAILAVPLEETYINLLPVIEQWGSTAQIEQYRNQRDNYTLERLTQILTQSDSAATYTYLQHLKQLSEPFPQSALGNYQLQVLLASREEEVWQIGKQQIVTALGDRSAQQAYRFVWLKTCLLQPDLGQLCSENWDYQQPYEAWLSLLGEYQVAKVNNLISQFLNQYDHSYPLGLEIAKCILSPEWVTRHQAEELMDQLATIEEVCRRKSQLHELSVFIQTQLNNQDYSKVANQFTFLVNQQAYCQHNDTAHSSSSQEAYHAGLSGLKGWLQHAVFSRPYGFAKINAIILPILPEGKEKEDVSFLVVHQRNWSGRISSP